LTCCPECLDSLAERQQYQDRLLEEKLAFEQRLALCREQLRLADRGFFHTGSGWGLLQDLGEIMLIRKLKRLERDNRRRRRRM
jgi:hypothetical protein